MAGSWIDNLYNRSGIVDRPFLYYRFTRIPYKLFISMTKIHYKKLLGVGTIIVGIIMIIGLSFIVGVLAKLAYYGFNSI